MFSKISYLPCKCFTRGCNIYRWRKQPVFQYLRFFMDILNVYVTVVELLGWESPMETAQQQESQLRQGAWVRRAGHATARERPGDVPGSFHAVPAGTELLSAITNSWAPRFSPGPCFLTTVDTKVVLGFRRFVHMARKGAWCLSVSTTTAVPGASQPVHQLCSLCFPCKCHFTGAAGHSGQCVWRSYHSSSPALHLRRAVMAQESSGL